MAISEAKRKSNKKWNDKNKEKMRFYVEKSMTKKFILTKAETEDLIAIKQWIFEREQTLEECRKNNEKEN